MLFRSDHHISVVRLISVKRDLACRVIIRCHFTNASSYVKTCKANLTTKLIITFYISETILILVILKNKVIIKEYDFFKLSGLTCEGDSSSRITVSRCKGYCVLSTSYDFVCESDYCTVI